MAAGSAQRDAEQNLIPHLTVTENIFLGREIHLSRSVDVIDRRAMRAKAAELLADLGVTISPTARVGTLGVGHQQMIEICRAMWADAKLIIMNEPTSSLSENEGRREDLDGRIAFSGSAISRLGGPGFV